MKRIIAHLLFLLVSLLSFSCKTSHRNIESLTCSGMISLQYDRDRDSGISIDRNLKFFTVYFIGAYNDDIEAFVNDKLYYSKHLDIDDNLDSLKEFFGYNYSGDPGTPLLKIISKTKDTCFDIYVNKKYKIIYVFLSEDGKWIVRFSNSLYILK